MGGGDTCFWFNAFLLVPPLLPPTDRYPLAFTSSEPTLSLNKPTQYSWWITAKPANGSPSARMGHVCCTPATHVTYTEYDVAIPRNPVSPDKCTPLRAELAEGGESTHGQSFISATTGTVYAVLISVWTDPHFNWDSGWKLNVLQVWALASHSIAVWMPAACIIGVSLRVSECFGLHQRTKADCI